MFRDKPVKEIFPIEAFQSLANWFLDKLLNEVANLNARREKRPMDYAPKIVTKISNEQKQEFVDECSKGLFEQLKDCPINPGNSRDILKINISDVAEYATMAKFPALCISEQPLDKPMASLIAESAKITFSDFYSVGDIYDKKNSIQYKSLELDSKPLAPQSAPAAGKR